MQPRRAGDAIPAERRSDRGVPFASQHEPGRDCDAIEVTIDRRGKVVSDARNDGGRIVARGAGTRTIGLAAARAVPAGVYRLVIVTAGGTVQRRVRL